MGRSVLHTEAAADIENFRMKPQFLEQIIKNLDYLFKITGHFAQITKNRSPVAMNARKVKFGTVHCFLKNFQCLSRPQIEAELAASAVGKSESDSNFCPLSNLKSGV